VRLTATILVTQITCLFLRSVLHRVGQPLLVVGHEGVSEASSTRPASSRSSMGAVSRRYSALASLTSDLSSAILGAGSSTLCSRDAVVAVVFVRPFGLPGFLLVVEGSASA